MERGCADQARERILCIFLHHGQERRVEECYRERQAEQERHAEQERQTERLRKPAIEGASFQWKAVFFCRLERTIVPPKLCFFLKEVGVPPPLLVVLPSTATPRGEIFLLKEMVHFC